MVKKISLNIASRLIVVLLMLVNIKLYTSFLDKSDLGIYFFLITVSYFANALIFVPLDYYQQSNLLEYLKQFGLGQIKRFIKFLLFYFFLASLFILIFILIFLPEYAIDFLLCALLSVAIYLTQTLRNTLNNLKHNNLVSYNYIIESIVKVLIFWIFCFFMNKVDSRLLILSSILGLNFSILHSSYFLIKYYPEKRNPSAFSFNFIKIVKHSLPLSFGAITNWLQIQGYRLFLVPLGYSDVVGIYSTVSNIGSSGIGILTVIYNNHFVPELYSSLGKTLKKFVTVALSLILFAVFIIFFLSDFIVSIILSSEFIIYSKLICFGIIVDGSNVIIGAMSIKASIFNKTNLLIVYSLFGVLFSFLFFILLFFSKLITPYTIGIPLILSQIIVILIMFKKINSLNQ
jgi:O-antigen/teichoic acid export membrane protein